MAAKGWATRPISVPAVILLSPSSTSKDDTIDAHPANGDSKKKPEEAQPAAGGAGAKKGGGGLPPDAVKLRGGQGYRDSNGNLWRKDMLHKDHWDVIDRKGNKIREVTFDGRQLWPNGPKNNQ